MGWSIDIAVATTHKYAIKESGDVVEIVDLPDGGVALIVADGQGSGPSARSVARSATLQAWSLLQQGVRPEAVVGAVSDAIFYARGGKVSVSLDIARVDREGTVDIARLSTNSLLLWLGERWTLRGPTAEPAGRYDRQLPSLQLERSGDVRAFLVMTDGVTGAGGRFDESKGITERAPLLADDSSAELLAETVFDEALKRDNGRPGDDMTVAACVLRRSQVDQRIERRTFQRDVR
jgi:hypothetical protein